MAQYDGAIRIKTSMNNDELKRGESEIKGSMGRISGAAKKFATVIGAAFAVGKIVQFGKEAVKLGSDLQEVQNVVDVTFTTMSKKVDEFAKNAAVSAGLSETMAKQYIGAFGAMSKSFGFSEQEAYDMSAALTQLSGDVASFYNISQDEAYTKLKSVFTGETETLKDLGVVMTQNALDAYAMANGFGKTTSAMTENEKVALRYKFVMDQLSGASGDFVRTSGGWANQVRVLKLQIDSLKATIGQGLINIFTPVIQVINVLLGKLATVANAFKAFASLITGNKETSSGGAGAGLSAAGGLGDAADEYNEAAGAADNLASSTDKVAQATKDAQKAAEGYLNPLDEINKFSKNEDLSSAGTGGEGGGVGAGVSGAISDVDYGNLSEGETYFEKLGSIIDAVIGKIRELAGLFKQGFFDGLGEWEPRFESIKTSIASIKDSLKNIFTDPAVLASADTWAQSVAYMLGSLTGSAASIGLTIAQNLVGGIATYLEQNTGRIKDYLISMFEIRAEINNMFAELFNSIAYVFEAFASEQGQQLTANLIGIFVNPYMGITELTSKTFRDIANIIIQPFVENKEGFRTALEGFLSVLSEVTGTIKQGIDDTFDKFNEVYDAHFKPFFDSIANGLSDLVDKFLDFWNENVQPMLDEMAKDFDNLWKTHIQPLVDQAIEFIGKIADLLKELWENVLQPVIAWIIQNILPKILPIIQSLWDRFMAFVKMITDSVKSVIKIFSGIIDFLIGIFTGDWERALDGIKGILGGVVDFFKSKFDFILGIVTGIPGFFKTKFELAFELAVGAFAGMVNFFKNIWGNIQKVFSGIKDWFRGKFLEAWIAVLNVFSSGGEIFDGIKDGILNGLKNVINFLIDGINEVIKVPFDGINSALKTIKKVEIAGFEPFDGLPTISTPQIPKLATGAVIPANREFLAVLGDQKHGTNIEAPLDTIKQANRESMLEVLSELGLTGNRGNGNPQTIIIKQYLDGKQVAESVVKEGKVRQMSTGNNMFMLGTT